jgi:hypothetical protein
MTMGTPEPLENQPVDDREDAPVFTPVNTPEAQPETQSQYSERTDTLSPEDAALFRQLLDDRRKQDQLAAEEAERTKVVPTHYLTLDNGEIVKSQGVMTHYGDHAVMNAALIPESEMETDENAR